MPVRASSLAANRRTISVSFGDDSLTLTYRPSSVNAVQEEREIAERARGQHLYSMAKSLAEIVESWDLLDEKDKPLPVTMEILMPLGMDVLRTITRAITEDLLPNRTTPTPSPNGSSAAASSQPIASPSGTPTS